MIKKRTKAIRNFLALLVLLTTGGTQQVWAQTETLSDLDDAQIQLSYDGGTTYNSSDGTVTGVAHENYNSFNWCLMVEIRVNPKAGYITKLSQMTSNWNGDDPYTSFGNVREGDGDPYEGELVFVPYDPADDEASPLYGHYEAKRTILVYSKKKNPNNFAVKISFTYVGIFLQNKLGDNATVTFYEPNADFAPEDDAYVFDPVAYTGNGAEIIAKTPADFIDNSDGNDHYVIAHIVPNPGYWTDRTLLMAYEAGGALARSRAPIVDPAYTLKLLQADTYDDAESNTKSRHDGAGWYYYKLPKEHNCTAGYKYSIIDGFAPKQFYLNGSNVWDPTNKVLTVTDGTTNGWSVEFTYDKVSYPFDGNNHRPKVDKLTVKYQGKTVIEYDGSTAAGRAAIDNQVVNGDGNDDCIIRDSHTINTNAAQPYPYCWFISGDYDAKFAITVPFSGSGTEADPWLIKGGADLTMLAKCVNIGYYSFMNQYVVLDKTCAYDVAADYAEFEPIGMKGEIHYTPFCGIFDGKDMTISGINYTYDPGLIVSDPSAVNSIGLFGQLGASSSEPIGVGIVKNVNLKDCTFATDYDKTFYVGGIAGYIDRGGIYNSTVSGSTVSASNTNSHTGAIFGHKNSDFVALQNNHYTFDTNVTLGSGTSATTASGYTKRGGYVGTAWGDITADEGAMLYVKKATVPPVNANGSKVEFNEVEKGNNRYDFGTDDDFYYAVGQPITLKVTTGTSTDGDIRTFYDELKALTMNGTDISGAKSFTMPEADATIAATFAPSDWFTIPSNGKQYMSFYHKWTTGGGTSASPVNANYAVTDYAGNETIGALTITNASIVTGKITTGDLNGVCYYDMPTLFYCKNGLPAILKFTPDAKASTNVKAWEKFKGTTVDKDMREFANVYVLNGIGDFYLSDITDTDYTLKAHHCYIAVGNIAGVLPARLHINGGEDTGIDDPRIDNTGDNGLWFTIDGRRMDSRPQKKGIYINGGRKVVIK